MFLHDLLYQELSINFSDYFNLGTLLRDPIIYHLCVNIHVLMHTDSFCYLFMEQACLFCSISFGLSCGYFCMFLYQLTRPIITSIVFVCLLYVIIGLSKYQQGYTKANAYRSTP